MVRYIYLVVAVGLAAIALPVRAELIDINNSKLQELIEQGVPVIDVRRTDEWLATGIVEGSTLQTFFDKEGRYDAPAWFNALDASIDTSKPLILICHSGARSSIIGKWLGKQLETVYNVESGIVKWIAEKQPVVAVKK